MKKTSVTALIFALAISLLAGCGDEKDASASKTHKKHRDASEPHLASDSNDTPASSKEDSSGASEDLSSASEPKDTGHKKDIIPKEDAEEVDSNPESITVLVNKQYALPENYEPKDLVFPDVPFTFKEKADKRKMRKIAAAALEKLFAAAQKDGIYLAGVSAYRSFAVQQTVFNRYVQQDGLEKARTYSAEPGHSEHETGLAIDVSGSDGKCAAEDCFGGTAEAEWLAKHAADYGFIIRYPEGKESITGYQYEPWHIRYVGTNLAKELMKSGMTLEEYFHTIPVSE